MNDDFPFNHFINLENLNKNNYIDQKTEKPEIKDYHFPNIEDTPSKPEATVKSQNQLLSDSSFNSDELASICEEILSGLKASISPQKYKAFFENSFTVNRVTQSEITFSVTTSFIKKMITNHYLSEIKQIIFTILGSYYDVNITVINAQTEQVKEDISSFLKTESSQPSIHNLNNFTNQLPNIEKPAEKTKISFKLKPEHNSPEEIKDEIESAVIKHTQTNSFKRVKFDGSKTFDNFVVGPSNNMAHAFCLAVAKDPGKVYPQLYIHGNSGLGKTHLLHAICNYTVDNLSLIHI